jgi:hypothetical protein
MNKIQRPERQRRPRRLLAADWARLSPEAQDQAIEIARHEGRRAARWYLAEAVDGNPEDASLRNCRWAQEHGDLDRLPDHIFYLYASASTMPCEGDYITFIVEPYCPERIASWWRIPRAHRLDDPRVCAFCDAYERERCRILGIEAPPTGITDLKQYLAEAKERERDSARAWLLQTEAGEELAPPEAEETDWAVVRWEHMRCMLATDLAQMLLDAALYWAQVR